MAVLLSRMDGAHTQALRTAGTWSKKKNEIDTGDDPLSWVGFIFC
jgi:hypothetical protein